MKAKALEILIAMGILFGLVLLTFVVGCKDEAEATDLIEFKFGDANDVRIEYEEPIEPEIYFKDD